jgi:hypothetical protein
MEALRAVKPDHRRSLNPGLPATEVAMSDFRRRTVLSIPHRSQRRRAMTTKTCGRRFRRGKDWVETLEWDEVLEALVLLEREPDLVPDRAGVVKALHERLGHLVREWLHEHPELVVQHPDGQWSLREDNNVLAFKPKDPPDGAA